MANQFAGLSSLRPKDEPEGGPKPPSEEAKRLQAYLAAQYGAGPAADAKPKKKKKKVKKEVAAGAVRIVDHDVTGFEAAAGGRSGGPQGAEEDDEGEFKRLSRWKYMRFNDSNGVFFAADAPVVANPEEAEALRRQAEQERELFSRGRMTAWETVEDGTTAQRPRHDSPDASPPRRRVRHDSPAGGSDASPPRRRQRHDSPGDASPPRRRARHDSPDDASPPRRKPRHDSPGSDASPPRRQQRHDSPGDASPLRRRARNDSPDDASPPRRRARHDSPGDASPPRRARAHSPGSDASPPRRRARHDSPEDASPPRRRPGVAAGGDSDASPPRRPPADAAGRRFMSDGTIAGMVSGREIQAEMARKKEAEARRFAELGADVTGRGAATVYRDKEGRQLTKEEFVEAREAEKRAGKAQYDDESALAWGGGLKQKAEREERERRMREEASRPFARGPDVEWDAEQREKSRWGDPMAHLVKRRAPGEIEAPPSLVAARAEAMKSSGFVIPLEVPQHSWLRRGVGAPSNRYSICPGRHWDGVDRSNGFESDMFKRQTELRRRQQEAHMMAQGDM